MTVRSAIDLPCLVCLSSRRPLPLAAVNGGTGAERSSGVEWTDDETRESERGRWSELVSLLVVEAFVLALNCTCCKLQPKDWGLPCMWCTALPGCLPCLVESKCCFYHALASLCPARQPCRWSPRDYRNRGFCVARVCRIKVLENENL